MSTDLLQYYRDKYLYFSCAVNVHFSDTALAPMGEGDMLQNPGGR